MRVGLYFPNKPLNIGIPSGDKTIAEGIVASLGRHGHLCREMTDFRSRLFWKSLQEIIKLPYAFWESVRRFRSFKPHIWVTYHSYYKSPDLFGWWLAAPRIPYVIIQPMRANKRRKQALTKLGAAINDIAIRRASLLISNNLMDIEALKRFVPSKELYYIPPGIFPDMFPRDLNAASTLRLKLSLPPNIPLLLTVCMFRKGAKWESLAFLFEALELLKSKKNFILLVIGSGSLWSSVRHYAWEKLGDRVEFLGMIPRSELFRYYSLADLFVFPGIGESLGMVYLEAQSCGCPVVALDSEGVRQVVCHGKTGILVSSPLPEAYADAVSLMLDSPKLRDEMGREGMTFVREKRNAHLNNLSLVRLLERLVHEHD
ncbi:MAG: glycosyltransferase family 4 protein [Thermodesulforhabdaceae bacterium]